MDMIPLICPWARRLIQKNNPTNSTRMKMVGSHWPRKLSVGVLYWKSLGAGTFLRMMATSDCGGGVPPFTLYCSPPLKLVRNVPVMTPVALLMVMVSICLAETSDRKVL